MVVGHRLDKDGVNEHGVLILFSASADDGDGLLRNHRGSEVELLG